LGDAGLPHAYFGILVTLAEAPEQRMRMGDLAAELDFSPSRLSHAVARMEAAGWVRRRPRPSSGRERDAQLTEQGSAVLRRAAPPHVALVRKLLFDCLDPEQLQTLQELCEQLAPALAAETADCTGVAECETVEEACDASGECSPDVALMELPGP
jgi:DNA-binding MarR family transcriptional regulator